MFIYLAVYMWSLRFTVNGRYFPFACFWATRKLLYFELPASSTSSGETAAVFAKYTRVHTVPPDAHIPRVYLCFLPNHHFHAFRPSRFKLLKPFYPCYTALDSRRNTIKSVAKISCSRYDCIFRREASCVDVHLAFWERNQEVARETRNLYCTPGFAFIFSFPPVSCVINVSHFIVNQFYQ